MAQLCGEGVEIGRQGGQFVTPMGVEVASQVTFAAGNAGHGVHCGLQRLHDAASDQHHQSSQEQGDQQTDAYGFHRLGSELHLYVIDIDAGADDPAPGLEQFDVGDFRYRVSGARFRPAVVDLTGPLAAGDGDHLVEQRLAVRVLETGKVLALELGIHRMHEHDRGLVVDPEVLLSVVAQTAHHLHGLLLRLFAAQAAGAFQAMEVLENTGRALHHMLGLFRFAGVKISVDLAQHVGALQDQRQNGQRQDQP